MLCSGSRFLRFEQEVPYTTDLVTRRCRAGRHTVIRLVTYASLPEGRRSGAKVSLAETCLGQNACSGCFELGIGVSRIGQEHLSVEDPWTSSMQGKCSHILLDRDQNHAKRAASQKSSTAHFGDNGLHHELYFVMISAGSRTCSRA